MKLYILEARDDLPVTAEENPWYHEYDMAYAFVVRAKSPKAARKQAHFNSGDETRTIEDTWFNPKYSTCKELKADGKEGEIVRDYFSG